MRRASWWGLLFPGAFAHWAAGVCCHTFWLKWLCSSSSSNGRAKETFAAASSISSAQILLYHQVFICFPLGEKGGTESSKIEDRLRLEGKSSRMVGKFWNDNTNWFFVFVSWSFFQCSTTSVIFVWVCKRIWLGLGLRGPGWVEQYGVLCSRFCDSAVVACTCKVHLHLRERPYAKSDFCHYLHLLAWFLMENLAWSIKPTPEKSGHGVSFFVARTFFQTYRFFFFSACSGPPIWWIELWYKSRRKKGGGAYELGSAFDFFTIGTWNICVIGLHMWHLILQGQQIQSLVQGRLQMQFIWQMRFSHWFWNMQMAICKFVF